MVLFTPSGVASILTQSFGIPISDFGNGCQPVFSPDGSKFAFTTTKPFVGNYMTNLNVFDFDRCTGNFSNLQQLLLSNHWLGIGTAFSPNSKYLYACTVNNIYQINTANSILKADTVATYDGYAQPISAATTDFYQMYLASDGKIYTTSNTTVLDFSCITSPDSGGLACNVQQHSLHLPTWHLSAVPNHPNYFLGPVVGSICDSLTVGINVVSNQKLTLKVFPNPVVGNQLSITYLLEQNKNGLLEVIDVEGRIIYKQNLPEWSTMQNISVSSLHNGIYLLRLTSGQKVGTIKLIVQ